MKGLSVNKRAIAILGAIFLLIVGTLGVLIYLRSTSEDTINTNTPEVVQEPDVNTNTPPTNTSDSTPPPSQPRATRLTDDSVVSPVLFFQGNGISYFTPSGQLFQTDLATTSGAALLSNKRQLDITLKSGVTGILWPQVGNSFIAELGSGSQKTWSYYDAAKGSYADLPSQVSSLDWLPTGDAILFVWADKGVATLTSGKPDTSGYQSLVDFYEPDNVIDVSPDGKSVLFYRTQTSDLSQNVINFVSPDGKVFRTVVKDGYNRGVHWSPDSRKFLFTKRDSVTQKFGIWMADLFSGEIRNLGVMSSEQKAVWSKDNQAVYVAVPTVGTAGEGITQDTLYRINVTTGVKEEIVPGVAVDMQNLFLNSGEDVLFFKNKQDQALYYIKVK